MFQGLFATTSVFIEKLLKTWARKSKEKITIAKSFYKLNPISFTKVTYK